MSRRVPALVLSTPLARLDFGFPSGLAQQVTDALGEPWQRWARYTGRTLLGKLDGRLRSQVQRTLASVRVRSRRNPSLRPGQVGHYERGPRGMPGFYHLQPHLFAHHVFASERLWRVQDYRDAWADRIMSSHEGQWSGSYGPMSQVMAALQRAHSPSNVVTLTDDEARGILDAGESPEAADRIIWRDLRATLRAIKKHGTLQASRENPGGDKWTYNARTKVHYRDRIPYGTQGARQLYARANIYTPAHHGRSRYDWTISFPSGASRKGSNGRLSDAKRAVARALKRGAGRARRRNAGGIIDKRMEARGLRALKVELLTPGAPNLDAEAADWLMAFWALASHHPGIAGKRMFPSRPAGYQRATKDLANYASNKATAMRERVKGNIAVASQYEAIADRIYDGLPGFAKW